MRGNPLLFRQEESPGGNADEDGEEESSQAQEAEGSSSEQEAQGEAISRADLAKANAEAAKYRKALRETQARVQELEDLTKTEQERIADQAKRAEEELAQEKSKNRALRVRVLASGVGIAREAQEDAARLLDWATVRDPDDDTQLEKALQNLVKEKPYLLGGLGGGADGGAGISGRNRSGSDMNLAIRRASGRA
jgi:hypothetical protein